MKTTKKTSNAKVSLTKKKRNGKSTLTKFGKTVIICSSVVVFLIISVFVCINMLIGYYWGLMSYVDIDKQTLLNDDEISRYLASAEVTDPSVTNSHSKDEVNNFIDNELNKNDGNDKEIEGIVNILLLGIDNSGVDGDNSVYGYGQNTDSMIIVTINEKTKRLVLTSLLRDSCVKIQKQNGQFVNARLNTAYVYGGYKELFATIDRNFYIQTDKFIQVDFSSFVDIVNLVDGVDVLITKAEAIEMNNVMEGINEVFGDSRNADKLKNTEEGVKHLNGKQALAYARIRYNTGNDFGRTDRQRKLILAVGDKIKNLNLSELNKLLTTMLSKVTTNLTQSECTSLMANALSYLNYDMQSMRIPEDGTWTEATVEGKKHLLLVSVSENYKKWRDLVTGN